MSTPTPESSSYHHGDLRNALIEAGLAILHEEGVGSLTLRRLARRANVSHAAPYRHFPDKDGLLAAIAIQGFQMLAGAMERAILAHPDQPRERLLQIGINYVIFGIEHPAHINLMFGNLFSRDNEALIEVSSRTYELFLGAVRDAQTAGTLKEEDPEKVAAALWSMVHGMAMLAKEGFMIEDEVPPEPIIRGNLNRLMAGIEP